MVLTNQITGLQTYGCLIMMQNLMNMYVQDVYFMRFTFLGNVGL